MGEDRLRYAAAGLSQGAAMIFALTLACFVMCAVSTLAWLL